MGKIKLQELVSPPEYLKSLMFNSNFNQAKYFWDNIETYNMMFSFTLMGGQVDTSIKIEGVPYVFRINGQNHHRIGSLFPQKGATPKFA